MSARNPHMHARRDGDHRGFSTSTMRLRAALSTSWSTMIRRPPASTITILPSARGLPALWLDDDGTGTEELASVTMKGGINPG
jgi:hypothetical protein